MLGSQAYTNTKCQRFLFDFKRRDLFVCADPANGTGRNAFGNTPVIPDLLN